MQSHIGLGRQLPAALQHDRRINSWHRMCRLIAVFSLSCLALGANGHLNAQSLNESMISLFAGVCNQLITQGDSGDPANPKLGFGPQLLVICRPGGGSTGGSGVSASGSFRISQGRTAVLEYLLASEPAETASRNQVAPGFAGVKQLGSRTSTSEMAMFVLPEWRWVDRINSDIDGNGDPFEASYKSSVSGVTAGIFQRIGESATGGLALGYHQQSGNVEGGGSFTQTSVGPIAFLSIPIESRGAVNTSISYSYISGDQSRNAAWSTESFGVEALHTVGLLSSKFNGSELDAQISASFRHDVGAIRILPSVGLNYQRTTRDAYKENGSFVAGLLESEAEFFVGSPTGLELAVDPQSVESLESVIGLGASLEIVSPNGIVMIPEIAVAWHHEFITDPPATTAKLSQDGRTEPLYFSYQGSAPRSNYLDVSVAFSLIGRDGFQASLSARHLLRHSQIRDTSVNLTALWEF